LRDSPDERTLALLGLRAERLRRSEVEREEPTLWVVEFPVGDLHYAIPMERLRAIAPLKRVASVPLAPQDVLGVFRFQGQVVTAFSLASMLGVRGWRHDSTVLLIVESRPRHVIAFDCEEIPRTLGIPIRAVEASRTFTQGGITPVAIERGTREVMLIDPAQLIADRPERPGGA
jgi:chemotaxis signal transduction protein